MEGCLGRLCTHKTTCKGGSQVSSGNECDVESGWLDEMHRRGQSCGWTPPCKVQNIGDAHLGFWHRHIHTILQEFNRYCCPLTTLASSTFRFSVPVTLAFSNNPRLMTLQFSHEQPRHTSVPLAHVMLAYTPCAAHPDRQGSS